ncbi:MAG TPA: four helix bundle protein [Bacteroidales bacterium]|jgi:four helix bundle protein|nr:four helix bundle protein [Bacteroidales bacterium]
MVNSFKDLIVHQKAHKLAFEIHEISLKFPKEEIYSLTDQIRRSSRSISANIAEAWAKRKYEKVFVNKLTDSLGEEHETSDWLDYSLEFKYLTIEEYNHFVDGYKEVRRMLIAMINDPGKWCL